VVVCTEAWYIVWGTSSVAEVGVAACEAVMGETGGVEGLC